jgi:hypothetical protein
MGDMLHILHLDNNRDLIGAAKAFEALKAAKAMRQPVKPSQAEILAGLVASVNALEDFAAGAFWYPHELTRQQFHDGWLNEDPAMFNTWAALRDLAAKAGVL